MRSQGHATCQAEELLTCQDMLRFEIIARGFPPDAGRTRQQVILGAGSQADFSSATQSDVVAKLVYYNELAVEPMRVVHLADETTTRASMALSWMQQCTTVWPPATRLPVESLPFNGMVVLNRMTLNALLEEINGIFGNNLQAAQAKVRPDEPARA